MTLGKSLPSELSPQPLKGEQTHGPTLLPAPRLDSGLGPEEPLSPLPTLGQALTPVSAGIAKACEQNLQRTLRFGGRLELPSSMELRAMLVSIGALG